MKRRICTILCAAAIVTSCTTDDTNALSGDKGYAVSIDPMIQTRATEISFESGDAIGLSITMSEDQSSFAENYQMTHNGTSFVSDLVWYEDDSATSTLSAYYPYVTGESLPTTFTVQADQTVDGAYTASDLMFAYKDEVTPTSSTLMTFKHVLSRVVVDVDNQSGSDITSVEISGAYPTATIDVEGLSVSVDSSSTLTRVNVPLWSDGLYKAIVVPQEVALTFTVTLSNGTVTSREKGNVVFVGGKEYTAKVTVTSDNIDVDLSGDAEDWTDGGLIPDASVAVAFEDFPDDNYFMYDGERYATVTLSNGTRWMASNLRYVPNGFEVSADPTENSEIWYPYDLTALTALTDDQSVETNGYLYTTYAAFGKRVEMTTDIADFEGAQGICPDGWHIPSRIEWFDLFGRSNANKYIGESSTIKLNEEALFYNSANQYGSKELANDANFNFVDCGVRMMTSFTTVGKYQGYNMSYYMSSTFYYNQYATTAGDTYGNWINSQFFGPMIYSDGKVALAYYSVESGVAVRCVKDSDKVYTQIPIDTTPTIRPTTDNPTGGA